MPLSEGLFAAVGFAAVTDEPHLRHHMNHTRKARSKIMPFHTEQSLPKFLWNRHARGHK